MNEQQKRSTWFWVLIGGGLFALVLAVIVGLAFAIVHATGGSDMSSFGGSDKIGVVDVDGVILSAETPISQLRKFADDSSIRAIILHINSPGGGAAASAGGLRRGQAHPRRERKSPSSPASRAKAPAAPTTSPPEPKKSTPTAPASSARSASSWSTPTTATC